MRVSSGVTTGVRVKLRTMGAKPLIAQGTAMRDAGEEQRQRQPEARARLLRRLLRCLRERLRLHVVLSAGADPSKVPSSGLSR